MRKTWFVTGAGSHLGADIVKAALAQGDCVVATDADASSLCTRLGHAGLLADASRLLALPMDIADGRAVTTALQAAVDRFGRLDVVVHGETLRRPADARARWPDTELVRGLFNVTRAALPTMRAQRSGRIHHLVPPSPGDGSASLFSIAGFCAAVGADVADDGITISAIAPADVHACVFAAWAAGEDQVAEEV